MKLIESFRCSSAPTSMSKLCFLVFIASQLFSFLVAYLIQEFKNIIKVHNIIIKADCIFACNRTLLWRLKD